MTLRRGRLVLHDHVVAAEAAVVALGAAPSPCFDVLRSWRARTLWEMALQPRGPGLHQLYRRPPLPAPLAPAMERGIARGWERRASRGDVAAREMVEQAARGKAEPALSEAVRQARRRLRGGPLVRLEVSFGNDLWVSGHLSERETSLAVRVRHDWYRTVGHPRRALYEEHFVVAQEPERLVVAWRQSSDHGWSPYLEVAP